MQRENTVIGYLTDCLGNRAGRCLRHLVYFKKVRFLERGAKIVDHFVLNRFHQPLREDILAQAAGVTFH